MLLILATLANDGGSSAVEPDYDRIRSVLERAMHTVCPSFGAAERDDIVQNAIMKVMSLVQRSRAKGEGNREFTSSYLYRVAHSAAIDELRRHNRRRETGIDDEDEEESAPLSVVSEQPGPAQLTHANELGAGIGDCLGTMTQNRRLAVVLYLQGHTVPEASRILGWTAKRTENLVYRGLADLRRCLSDKGLRP